MSDEDAPRQGARAAKRHFVAPATIDFAFSKQKQCF
jgi:hypothetical protein